MKSIEYNGVIYYVGQNCNENWSLLDTNLKINDNYIWFHLNSFPSCYVIMCSTLEYIANGNEYNNYLYYGAELCKQYSKYKFNNLKVIYTTLNKLTKTNKVGEVIVKGKKKIITLK